MPDATDTTHAPDDASARRRARRRIVKRAALVCGLLLAAVVVGAYLLTRVTAGSRSSTPPVRHHDVSADDGALGTGAGRRPLRVMTLNVAHGRSRGLHQALLGRKKIERNLDAIAAVLRRERPDVVALQESDGPSAWSGGFDHVERLAVQSGYPWSLRGNHVHGAKLAYGTALLARPRPDAPRSKAFAPSPPTFTKGFVAASVRWPPSGGARIEVVSVHLDFSRRSVQRAQVEDLVDAVAADRHPLIVMGDFNCEWGAEDSPLQLLAEGLHLRAHRPEATGMATFPTLGTRIDWILISPGLEFVSYRVVPDTVSDHLGVVAEIAIAAPARDAD